MLPASMKDGGLLNILGFPARLIGGGAPRLGADSWAFELLSFSVNRVLRGSIELVRTVVDCKKGVCFASIAGVGDRLGILK